MNLDYHRVHIVGAGGAGMSAIAKVLVGMGHEVTGSDLRSDSTLDRLADFGVVTHSGSQPDIARAADLVVASSAVPERDAELLAAASEGKPVWRRPRLLGAMTSAVPTLGATGTHGKTTTTAMLVTALRAVGKDPSFILGGEINALGTNGYHGSDDLLVIEADEAFRTFEHLTLRGLIVTNVEPEHLEHFGSEAEMRRSFVTVAAAVEGPVVACIDDAGAADLARQTGASTYGTPESARWRLSHIRCIGEETMFSFEGPEVRCDVNLARPGRHMALNAGGVLALLGEIGLDVGMAAAGLSGFTGVARRWEHRGTIGGVALIDDYAHHPTEVGVNLEAARSAHQGRVWAVFQPHLYSRTRMFSDQFGEALASADRVVVTDVYGSRETPIPGITGELVADAVEAHGGVVDYIPHRVDVAGFLVKNVQPGDLVITMGAGDITLVATELALLLAGQS